MREFFSQNSQIPILNQSELKTLEWWITLIQTELNTLEWWISGLMLNPLFFLISRLNIAGSPHEFNLQS